MIDSLSHRQPMQLFWGNAFSFPCTSDNSCGCVLVLLEAFKLLTWNSPQVSVALVKSEQHH